ncbi:hypothetical protein Poly24_02550 [Rosistilla carotiformis]|uniref:Chromosome partition protein Smc n=1 Tax=Rosistilla carotiformis TaxID=2528017 RepID=A0A518JM02_9BACT|nr:hypothetical protein [Rosistilla carotiformis]QDV66568.1 hypothetical protein Poly24_02550 [Rosistilla carotiformis]
MNEVNFLSKWCGVAVCFLLVLAATNGLAAEYDLSRDAIAQADGSAAERPAEGERRVTEFVKSHLPELESVLASLKKHSAKEYQKAIGDLARTSRRLEQLQQRDPDGFELELTFLQWQTRVDIALAQLQVRDNEKTRAQLRKAIASREQAKVARAQHEKARLTERIARMQTQLQRLTDQLENVDAEKNADKAYTSAIRRLDAKQVRPNAAARTKKNAKSKPATDPQTPENK